MRLNFKNFLSQKANTPYSRLLLLFTGVLTLCSHDLYLKMETYFLQPNQEATLSLYNGTFEKSENIITRDRMLDASVVAQGNRTNIPAAEWQDQDSTITQFTFTTGEAGTYVAGVSTKARNIELAADKFNSYLEHDGILDMLDYRTENDLLGEDAVERYQKHVKAVYQVGDVKTDDWSTVLGYPIEFVPQSNPYETYSGGQLDVLVLLDGQPLANQLVYADHISSHHDHGHKHDHDHDHNSHSHDGEGHSHGHGHNDDGHHHDHTSDSIEGHSHTNGQKLRTNEQGIVTVKLPKDGIYFIRTIHMTPISDSDELTHESKWATLTFEVTHEHGTATHTHDDHEHENEIPTWVFILGSILIVGIFFFIFRKKA
ncbi:MAG: DUF4198 domain-containing protein [Croceivirga sp.]